MSNAKINVNDQYSTDLEIDDNTDWRTKANKLSLFIPLLQSDYLVNKDEVKTQIHEVIIDSIKRGSETSSYNINEQMSFFNYDIFWNTLYGDNQEGFIEILEYLADNKLPKIFIEGSYFYLQHINTEEKYEDIYLHKFNKNLRKMNLFSEEDEELLPQTKLDFEVLYKLNIPNYSESDLFSILHTVDSESYNKIFLETPVSNSLLKVYSETEVVGLLALQKCFSNSQSDLLANKILANDEDKIKEFLDIYIEKNCSKKSERNKILNLIESYNDDKDTINVFLIDCINECLLEDTPNKNSVKMDLLEKNLKKDSGLDGDDPFNF